MSCSEPESAACTKSEMGNAPRPRPSPSPSPSPKDGRTVLHERLMGAPREKTESFLAQLAATKQASAHLGGELCSQLSAAGQHTNIMELALAVVKTYGFTHWKPLLKFLSALKPTDLCDSQDEFEQRMGCTVQAAMNAASVFIAAAAKHEVPGHGYDFGTLRGLASIAMQHGVPEVHNFCAQIGAPSVPLLLAMAETKARLKSYAHKANPDMPDHLVDRIFDFARTLKRENDRKAAAGIQRAAAEQRRQLKRKRDADATDSDDDEGAITERSAKMKRCIDNAEAHAGDNGQHPGSQGGSQGGSQA